MVFSMDSEALSLSFEQSAGEAKSVIVASTSKMKKTYSSSILDWPFMLVINKIKEIMFSCGQCYECFNLCADLRRGCRNLDQL